MKLNRHHHLATLITECAEGDHMAFRELHALTRDYLYHTALRLLRLPSLAEDALQDAYLNIWLHASSFRPGQASPMTWLIAIVRNRALSILRSRKSGIAALVTDDDPELLAHAEQGDDHDAGIALFDALARIHLKHAMTRLEPAQRQSIALAFERDLTHAEIAQHLGVPLGTAKSWLRRGLERLRLCMEDPLVPAAQSPAVSHRPGIPHGGRWTRTQHGVEAPPTVRWQGKRGPRWPAAPKTRVDCRS